VTATVTAPGRTPWLGQTIALSKRSVLHLLRQPSTWIPGMVFPLLLASVNSSSLARATQIPGFPPDATYLQFVLPACIVQGVIFGSLNGGTELANDIQSGFFDRLMSSPVSRPSILLGRLAGSTLFGFVQAVIFTIILWPFGATVKGGVGGVLVLWLMGALLALGLGAIAAGVGARTGEPEAVQGFFPLLFIFLFLSSCFFPTNLMSGFYRTVADNNPLTWMVDGVRHQVIVGFGLSQAATALGICLMLCVVGISFATLQMRHRWKMAG